MTVPLPTCEQMSFWDTISVTSLPVSEAGPTPSPLPGGRQAVRSGPAPVPASPSVSLDKDGARTTPATSGPSSGGSSPSVVLQSSLESRLHRRLAGVGSPEYVLTWKRWDMESGPPICALRARAPRISGRGYSGWPTPIENDVTGSTHCCGKGVDEEGNRKRYLKLPGAAQLAGWRTPNTTEPGISQERLQTKDGEEWMPGQRAYDKETGRVCQVGLTHEVRAALAGWLTPKLPRGDQAKRFLDPARSNDLPDCVKLVSGPIMTSSPAGTARSGALNPAFTLWLMGYPPEWFSCVDWATLLSRRSRKSS